MYNLNIYRPLINSKLFLSLMISSTVAMMFSYGLWLDSHPETIIRFTIANGTLLFLLLYFANKRDILALVVSIGVAMAFRFYLEPNIQPAFAFRFALIDGAVLYLFLKIQPGRVHCLIVIILTILISSEIITYITQGCFLHEGMIASILESDIREVHGYWSLHKIVICSVVAFTLFGLYFISNSISKIGKFEIGLLIFLLCFPPFRIGYYWLAGTQANLIHNAISKPVYALIRSYEDY